MDTWPEVFVASVVAFIATNIDDIFLLVLFFSERSASFRATHIVAGQYLGFCALIAVSALGSFGSLVIPVEWIGLLGVLPIVIAVKKVLRLRADLERVEGTHLQHSGAASGILSGETLGVAGVTIANGGDNIGVYIPFFANFHRTHVAGVIACFLVMVGVWCFIAYRLSNHRGVAIFLERIQGFVVPVVLAGLGCYIIYDTGAWAWLTGRLRG